MSGSNPAMHYDAVIVGAGVIGVTLAYELTRAGVRTAVVEREECAAQITSFANGGLITPSMSDPWAAPGVPSKLFKWIGKDDAPLLLRMKALPGLIPWGTAFLSNCNLQRWESNTRNMLALSKYSQRRLRNIAQENGLENHLSAKGGLRIFDTQAALDAALIGARFLEKEGIRHTVLSADECLRVEPTLAQATAIVAGGIYYPDDLTGDCRAFTQALSETTQRLGGEFHFGVEAKRVKIGTGGAPVRLKTSVGEFKTGALIVATSFPPKWLRGVASPLLYPVKGYSTTLDIPDGVQAPQTPIIDDGRKIGVVPYDKKIRLVGTAEFTGEDRTLNAGRLNALIESARAVIPYIKEYPVAHQWTGMRAMSPDGAPYIGAVGNNVYVSVGHGHLGWTNACGAAGLLKSLILGAVPDIEPPPFSPQRS